MQGILGKSAFYEDLQLIQNEKPSSAAFPQGLDVFLLWHLALFPVYKSILRQLGTERLWQLDEGEMWVGDQPWHCSYLKVEHKDKLDQKSCVPQSFLFPLNTNTESPRNNSTPEKERCLSVHCLMLSYSVRVMFKPERLVSVRRMRGADKWQCNHVHTQLKIQKHAQVMQDFLLTAPVPYRHHLLLLASNPGTKKKSAEGKRKRLGRAVKE